MIFIINETDKPLKLKSTEVDDRTILSALIDDAELPIIGTSEAELAEAIMNRFAEPEVVRNQRSKFNFFVEGNVTLITALRSSDDAQAPNCMLELFDRKRLPARYTTSKDLIAVIYPRGEKDIYLNDENLTYGEHYEYISERSEYGIVLYPIKWYDWSRLTRSVVMYVNDTPTYQLSYTLHKDNKERTVNVVEDLRKSKKN